MDEVKQQTTLEVVEKKIPRTDFLQNRTVIVKFLPRKVSKEVKDPKHIAYGGKLEGCFDFISPPRMRKDVLKNILTKEEKEGLEYLMGEGVNLSIYSNFWKGFGNDSLFPIRLGKEDLYLNLSVPEDYITYKVLCNSKMVATSQEQLEIRQYKYIIVDEYEDSKQEQERFSIKTKAYSLYDKIQKSSAKLRYTLHKFDKYTNPDQTFTFLRPETGKCLEKNPEKFIRIVGDDYFDLKVLLNEAFVLGVIQRMSGQYFTQDNDPIAQTDEDPNEYNAARFLSSPVGQEMRLQIQARVKNARET